MKGKTVERRKGGRPRTILKHYFEHAKSTWVGGTQPLDMSMVNDQTKNKVYDGERGGNKKTRHSLKTLFCIWGRGNCLAGSQEESIWDWLVAL